MKVECLIDLDDIELDLDDDESFQDSSFELNQAFNALSNPYLEWAENNKPLLFIATQKQLCFKFYLEFKSKVDFKGVIEFKEHYLECESLCIHYLNKVLTSHLKQLISKELIQKELDSFLLLKTSMIKPMSAEQYKAELDRKSALIQEDLALFNLRSDAFDWMHSKHSELFAQLHNPRLSDHAYSKMFKSAIKWDLKKNQQGVLRDSLMPYIRGIYAGILRVFREYSIQQNRLTLLDSKVNKHSPLKMPMVTPIGASKSDFNRVTSQALSSTVTSKRVKLSLPACAKPALYPESHSLSDLPYDSKLRDTGLIKVLRKRRLTP